MFYLGVANPPSKFVLYKLSETSQRQEEYYRVSSVVEIRTKNSKSEVEYELGAVLERGVEEYSGCVRSVRN